jgi:hypothetical protein
MFKIHESEFKPPHERFKIQNLLLVFCLFSLAFFIGCVTGSMPNLDKPECTQSRDVVKKFYSIHFDGEMKFSPENLKSKEQFFTPEFLQSLQKQETENDIFTSDSTDFPRAFRLGSCEVIEPSKTKIEVLIFWRDTTETRQQSIYTEVVNQQGKWLINKILR